MISISIVIPTYNSAKTLPACLESIREQDYPVDKVEIIIADAGSSDGTVEIARRFTDKIYCNSLKTSEAGKAVGLGLREGRWLLLLILIIFCLRGIGL